MIKVGIPTLMIDAVGFYETLLKICQTIGHIHHETSYLHCHPSRSSDLRQIGRTPRSTCNYPNSFVRGTAYVDTNGIQLRMVFQAMTSVRLERETNHDLPQRSYMYIQPFSTSV